MPIFSIILLSIAAVYLLEMVFFRFGLRRMDLSPRNRSYEPGVSVIVAARNEEENIAECIASLVVLDYPKDKCEVIVVNDGSTDRTAAIVEDLRREHPEIRLVNAQPGSGELRGKANALAQGIERSKGDILMFTDADCRAPSSWVKETMSYYTEDVGMVAGFTSIDTRRTFDGMQALDWHFLLAVASAMAAWDGPLTAVGNNLSVRRTAYDAVGGYRNLPFSVTEDYRLVQAVWGKTGLKIRYPVNARTVVQSKPCVNRNDLFRQRQRWGVGGLDMVLRGLLVMSVQYLANLSIMLGSLLAILSSVSWTPLLLAIAAKIFADWILLSKPLRVFQHGFLLKYLLAFELYYMIYGLLLPFVALLSRKVVWKERAFGEK